MKKGKSISRKMSGIIAGMIIVSMVVVGVFGYVLFREGRIEENAERAMAIAQAIAAGIDTEDFVQVLDTGEKSDAWYAAKYMADTTARQIGTAYLYVLDARYNSVFTYYLEGYDPASEEDELDLWAQEDAQIFQESIYETLSTGKLTKTGIYPSGDFGEMVSGFAPVLDAEQTVIGVVGVDLSVDEVMGEVNSFGLKTLLIVLALSCVFALLSVLIMRKMVARPIQALTQVSGRIAVGDLDVKVDITSNDEIGQLAQSFADMTSSTRAQVEHLQKIAQGDLTPTIQARSDKDMMSYAMIRTLENLNNMFGEISKSTAQVSSAANQIADGSQILAEGANEQNMTVEGLMGIIDRVSEKAAQNTGLASDANVVVDGIKKDAGKGASQMEEMVEAVRQIDTASQGIRNVIRAIDDIASQTNILALNASVEAARAGEHGKGFAVVADQVRNLAAKSASSAQETGDMIDSSIAKAALGVKIANETFATFEEIVDGINKSSGIITRIAQASVQQSREIADIHTAMAQVSQVVQQNSASAEESAAASEQLSSQSDQLNGMLKRFKLKNQ